MAKHILKYIGIVLAMIALYYLGSLNLHKKLLIKKMQSQPKAVLVSPSPTPFPAIDQFEVFETVKEGVKYSDKLYGLSFITPQDLVVVGTPCNLSIEKFTLVPHGPMWNYLHIAVIPKK
jgi:hypothetical protein